MGRVAGAKGSTGSTGSAGKVAASPQIYMGQCPKAVFKETLIKSQSQLLQEFLYITSSYPSLNSSLFASGYSSLCIKIQE